MKTDFGFNSPVNIKKEINPGQNIHWQDDFELIVVVKGMLSLSIGFEKFILNQGDIMIVNSLESHSFSSLEDDTEVMLIEMSKDVCLKINPFFYESIAIVDYSVGFLQLQECRERVTKSIVALLKSLPQEPIKGEPERYMLRRIHQRLEELLNTLSNVYRPKILKGEELIVAPLEKIEMLYRMIAYLYDNYNKTPSLDDFLKNEHYSLYYMSHVIVEITGTSFRDWLTYVRVEESEKFLLSTDMPISRIAKEVGFSSVRYYNSNFKKWYGFTPLDYRRLYKDIFNEEPLEPNKEFLDAENYLLKFMDETAEEVEEKLIELDFTGFDEKEKLLSIPRKECLVDYTELKDKFRWEHLDWIKDELGIEAMRLTSLNNQETRRKRKDSFDPLARTLKLENLVTTEGRKTAEFYFYSLLSLFGDKKVMVTPWSIISISEDKILVMIIHREEFSLDHELDDFRLVMDNIYGKFKVATYKCDLDFFKNDTSIVGDETISHLDAEDFKAINAMHEPDVYFEIIECTGKLEQRIRLLGNSCQMIILQKVS